MLSPTTERRKININGVEVYAIVEVTPDRKVTEYDIKKGIANRDPYQSTIVNKLVSVEVTDQLRKSTVNKALTKVVTVKDFLMAHFSKLLTT